MARRSDGVPQVIAYWWKSPSMARWAASTSSRGGGKLGMPWARLMPSYWLLTRVISRMTDSVKPCTRLEIIWRPSGEDDVVLDGIDRDALPLEPRHSRFQPLGGAFQLEHAPAVIGPDIGAPDIGDEVEVLHQAIDEGPLDQLGGKGQAHAQPGHGPHVSGPRASGRPRWPGRWRPRRPA